jgi:hypothetical protein
MDGSKTTIGAASSIWGGPLVSDIHRPTDTDVTTKKGWVKLDIPPDCEEEVCRRLMMLDRNYRDNLKYVMFPAARGDGYNSNSYVAGILKAAGIEPPRVPGANVPGYNKPVPRGAFNPPSVRAR